NRPQGPASDISRIDIPQPSRLLSWCHVLSPQCRASLLRLDIGLADGASVVVVLLAKERVVTGAADANPEQPLCRKLRPHVGSLQRRGEPSGKLGDDLGAGPGRR